MSGKLYIGGEDQQVSNTEEVKETDNQQEETVDNEQTNKENSTKVENTSEEKNISNSEESNKIDISALQKEIEKLKKQVTDSQSFIGRQSSLIGSLRSAIQEKQKPDEEVNPKELLDKFVQNPRKLIEDELSRRESARMEQQRIQEEYSNNNVSTVVKAVPNINDLIADIIEEVKLDGATGEITAETVKASMETEPLLVINYAKRAEMRKMLSQEKTKGKTVIQKIANGSKKTPPITSNNPKTTGERSFSPKEIAKMSDAELKKYLSVSYID